MPGVAATALRRLVEAVRAHRLLVVLVTATFTVASLVVSTGSEERYSAEARINLRTLTETTSVLGFYAFKEEVASDVQAARLANLARTDPILADARRRLGPRTARRLDRDGIAVRPDERSGELTVTVTNNDRRAAAAIANAVAEALLAQENGRFAARVRELTRQYERYASDLDTAAERFDVLGYYLEAGTTAVVDKLQLLRGLGRPARISQRASVPGGGIVLGRETLPALLMGLSVAVIAASLIEAIDARPRSPERMAMLLGAPAYVDIGVREQSYANVLAQLGAAPVDGSAAVLLTSLRGDDDVVTTSLDVAHAIASAGRRVALVDVGRNGRLTRTVGAAGAPGLTDVLSGRLALAQALRRPPRAPAFLAAGSASQAPADAVADGRGLDGVIEALRRDHDLVVLCSPALLDVAEPLGAVRAVDAAVVVARRALHDRGELIAARQRLALVAERTALLVLPGLGAPSRRMADVVRDPSPDAPTERARPAASAGTPS